MRPVFQPRDKVDSRAAADRVWWGRYRPALIAAVQNGYWFDADHPAWKAALADKSRAEKRPADLGGAGGGCSDCGGTVDAAKIRSSPEGMERFLRGEE